LNGSKMWITNGSNADISIVWAKLDGVVKGFIVPNDTPGFSTVKTEQKWSLRASITSELIMEDCRIPTNSLLPKSNGLGSPLSCLTQARFGIAWGVIGAAMACFDEALRYSLERKQFDTPLAGFQLVQNKLTEMATEITKAQFLNLRLAQLKQSDNYTFAMVSMAKRNGCYQALRIARMARDILGAAGITYEFQSGRHMLNLESVITYEGTHDIHALIVGADLTGVEAYK
jgi:glutaryl-CoA dehydrogenase